jgi:aryl-alcohol dehydrogenase-like predicted oxidoreductase
MSRLAGGTKAALPGILMMKKEDRTLTEKDENGASGSSRHSLEDVEVSRAGLFRLAGSIAAMLASQKFSLAQTRTGDAMHRRPIPSSGELLPVIGCGTYVGFDVGQEIEKRRELAKVVQRLRDAGGTVFDSSPMYGRAEGVLGDLLAAAPEHQDGIAQMERSFALLKTRRIDLMQVHNLVDWAVHLPTLRDWKQAGRIRYLGVTHYTAGAYDELEAVMRKETLDFVQLNYSLDDRAAERKLLPLAADRGIAVLVNLPFGGGGLLRSLRNRPLPEWAGEIGCTSWAQILLKFVLSHPSVTCAIPGTGNAAHMAENSMAGMGTMPDASFRNGIVSAWRSAN